ncbi:MAG: GreA/GreB family elongation factor [Verrucomicrobia subdivision 3 bacterium]|nr:GreA/GreB family elongation factor [Limisphaerales bacterium]
MREEFEKLVATGKLHRHHVEPLVQLTTSGYCLHRSWGFGKITSVDTVFARFTIDFQSRAGHTMDLGFAAESLKPIDPSHILARKASDLEGLRQMAALHHLDLIKLVLQSYGGRALLEQIQQVLVPDVIRDDWKKWWEVAKREMKKDGHFQIPTKKSEPIIYQSQEVALDDRLLADFRQARGLKAKVAAAHDTLRSFPDVGDKARVANEMIAALNADITTHQRTQPAVALEAIFIRDEMRHAAGLPAAGSELTTTNIWNQENIKFSQVLEQLPAAKHRRTLQSFKEANPERWHETLLANLNNLSAKVAGECASMLIHEGKLSDLKDTLARLISHHTANSELLLWLARERSDAFADILGPEVFRAMLTAMERDQFNERRSNRLRDFILDDQELLVELIGSADLDVIKDLTRALQLSPCFDDMDKRSLLARIVKSYPAVQALISGDQAKQEQPLLVSWQSLERRKHEYTELVQRKIPANSKEIAIARSYGDLRENHEYKAAKEMQKILMRRKGELEYQLVRARGTDFSNPRTDVASIGTRVRVTDLHNQHLEAFAILGAWDSDPEKGTISYLSPVAQSLLNHKVGEEIEFEMDGSRKRFRIDAIEPVQPGGSSSAPPSLQS